MSGSEIIVWKAALFGDKCSIKKKITKKLNFMLLSYDFLSCTQSNQIHGDPMYKGKP